MIQKKEYKGHEIAFMLGEDEVMIDVRGVIKAGRNNNKEIKDEKLRNIVSNFMRKGYDEEYCRFDSDDTGRLVVWMDSDLAAIFAKKLSPELADWCKTTGNTIMGDLDGSEVIAKKMQVLNHQKYEYDWHPEETPEGLAQSFKYCNNHIMLCVTESGDVVVNARQVINVFKQGCFEWYSQDSTNDLVVACLKRGGISWMTLGLDYDTCSLWMDVSLVEDLATWYEKGNKLKSWLRDRAEELRFFKRTAKRESLLEAYGSHNYLTYNCKIGRV